MEPSSPDPQVPYSGGQFDPMSSMPQKGRRFSKKGIFIIVGIVVVSIVLLLAFGGDKGKKDQGGESKRDTSLYIDRAGYEDAGDGIGDATGLAQTATDKVISYGGVNILQPCALITMKDIKDAGLKINANQLPGQVSTGSFDGLSNTPYDTNTSFLPSDPEGNYCTYFLPNLETVDITAYQPPYATVQALESTISRQFGPVADTNGVKTYKNSKPNNLSPDEDTYLLRDGTTAVKLRLNTANKTAKDKLLALLATRFAESKSKPTPRQQFTFKSPVFNASALTSCDLLSPSAFQALAGTEPSATLIEKFGSAVGVIRVENKNYNYVSYDCRRDQAADTVNGKSVILQTQTYETVEGAKAMFKYEHDDPTFVSALQDITPVIGDESFYANTAALNKAVVVRKGRVIIRINYYAGNQDGALTPTQRIEALRPILSGLNKLSGF